MKELFYASELKTNIALNVFLTLSNRKSEIDRMLNDTITSTGHSNPWMFYGIDEHGRINLIPMVSDIEDIPAKEYSEMTLALNKWFRANVSILEGFHFYVTEESHGWDLLIFFDQRLILNYSPLIIWRAILF